MRYPVSFYNEGQKIIGVVHRPDGPPAARYPAVVICHGFTGQKVEPHRIFVKTAEKLAAQGYLALRFDFRGSGDSEGEFHEMTVEGEISDAIKAVDYLVAAEPVDPERIGVVGLSMGGAVAACLTGRDRRIKATVLWAAVADFEMMGTGARFSNSPWVAEFDAWDYGGNLVGRRHVESAVQVRPSEEIKQARGPVLILHGDNDQVVSLDHAHLYRGSLAQAGVPHELTIVPGGDHTFNSYPWERQVIEATAAWFAKHL